MPRIPGQGDEHYGRIIDTAPDAFVGMDARGLVTDWNPAAEAMFGFSRDEAVAGTSSPCSSSRRPRGGREHCDEDR